MRPLTSEGVAIPSVPTRWLVSPALRIFALLLCGAVFWWGLEAKLSQYKEPTASHLETVAKIIQDGQLNKKNIGEVRLVDRRCESQHAIDSVAFFLGPRFVANRSSQIRRRVFAFLPIYPDPLFFRPPPSKL